MTTTPAAHDSDREAREAFEKHFRGVDLRRAAAGYAVTDTHYLWIGFLAAWNTRSLPAADMLKLLNPNAVHINMLRGTIAKPSMTQIEHIYQDEFRQAAAALLRANGWTVEKPKMTCADCNSVRMVHCSDPIHCGSMNPACNGTGARKVTT